MTRRSLRARWPFAVAVSLLALLCVLGWLQYRWVGQVSAAERERMEARLRTGSAQFASEFDRELARTFLTLQVSPLSPSDDFATRFELWRATSQYPKLVRDVYVARAGDAGPLALERYDRDARAFATAEWPADLSGVRGAIESARDAPGAEEGAGRPAIATVHEEVPALVSSGPPFGAVVRHESGRVELSGGGVYTIIVLDREYMRDELLPGLAARYFPPEAADSYRLAVLGGPGSPEPLYVSDPGLTAADFDTADATAPLFGLPRDEMAKVEVGNVRVALPRNARVVRHVLPDHAVVVPVPPRLEVAPPEPGEQKEMRFFFSERGAGLPAEGRPDGKWTLAVRHRAGSLDAAVAGARARNLAVGLGILVLLGASVLLLLASTRRAQALARQQMEFVAGVSHELRTPLAVIRSAGENLAHGVVSSPPQVRQYGALIEGEGKRLSGMVEQVLQFAGSQAGKRRYEMRPADAGAAVEDALSTYRHELDAGGFDVECDVQPGLPDVLADPAALRQAVENLMGNAIKYGGDARWVRVSARCEGADVVVSVEDRGRGIPRDEVDKVFEPFFRGREAVSDQIHGNGLGLSLVRHAAEAHGWRVAVDSEPGRGSVFSLRMPALAAARAESV